MDMIQMSKQLIDKGNELGDKELVRMGMEMLEKYNTPNIEIYNATNVSGGSELLPLEIVYDPPLESDFEYVCSNCDCTFPYDKPDRKKCPECKKHTLKLITHHVDIAEPVPVKRFVEGDFSTQIRKKNNSRIRYNSEGKPEGTYARIEQVEGVTNVWSDDKTEGFDPENEKLKQLTKVSQRTRKPTRMMEVVCENCKTKEMVHPIHAGARGRYLCDRCIRRRSKV